MTTEQQQVAMIQTLLHLMGAKDYKPSASTVLALLREFSQSTVSGWSTVKNPAPVNPTKGWDVAKNQAAGTQPTTGGWDVAKNKTATGATTSGWDVSRNQASFANKPGSRQS